MIHLVSMMPSKLRFDEDSFSLYPSDVVMIWWKMYPSSSICISKYNHVPYSMYHFLVVETLHIPCSSNPFPGGFVLSHRPITLEIAGLMRRSNHRSSSKIIGFGFGKYQWNDNIIFSKSKLGNRFLIWIHMIQLDLISCFLRCIYMDLLLMVQKSGEETTWHVYKTL